MLKAIDIHKSFGDLEILKGLNIEIAQGEIVSIVGSSGAGKTTLLQVISSLSPTDQGQIFYDNVNISNLNQNQLADFRNKNIGFIFQFHHLLPEFNALENVFIPAIIKGESKSDASAKAIKLLNRLGLEKRLYHKPSELSGGEQQRVATARALINNPKIIFADEPSGNLDSKTADELHQLFFELRKEFNQTFVIVTHNQELASLCDRKLLMKDGKIY
ncbi:MAG: ABC transporter ATP-binding protein [Bacteroidetes bacterium]|nr:MAG: ABC transporter ATP-binding protein [Bacteroidota bacterium]MBL1144545.1 ABC transporter ATP-binding protein [Bacteroidota bacterium]NOG57340.1 ABC transporter ATP-binding protein [Bacteroidota bacterium]